MLLWGITAAVAVCWSLCWELSLPFIDITLVKAAGLHFFLFVLFSFVFFTFLVFRRK